MGKNYFWIAILSAFWGTAWGQIALDTTIELASPELETIALNFPQINLQLEYRTELRGTCPNRIQEGNLYSPDTNKVKITKDPEDAAALYFIVDNCADMLNIFIDVEGKTFSLVTPTVTYSLVLHEQQNSRVQFVFTRISTSIVNMDPFPILPLDKKAYNLTGRQIPPGTWLRNQVKIIPRAP